VNGDAIAVIPELVEGTDIKEPRFINISGSARKLAFNPNTFNIFLLSMCRLCAAIGDFEYLQEDTQTKDQRCIAYT
jgi:hypothetical protein